jgi:hypothetical protein
MDGRCWLGLAALLLVVGPSPAKAAGFALDTLEPPPPGDPFFSVPGGSSELHRRPTVAAVVGGATRTYGLYQSETLVPEGWIVRERLTVHAGAALGVGPAVLDVSLPLVVEQDGDVAVSGVAPVAPGVLGDLRLGARVAIVDRPAIAIALGAMAFVPTGDRDAFASDGALRVQPQLAASGGGSRGCWSAVAGYHWRQTVDAGPVRIGAAVVGGAAAALRFGAFQVGPEVTGRWALAGTESRAIEALLGARWRRGEIAVGVAAGGRVLDSAPGAAPLRALVQLAWTPGERSR